MTSNPFAATAVLENEPESIVLGKYRSWRRELLDVDDDEYSVKYVFRPIDGRSPPVELSGVYDGSRYWMFTITSAATAEWKEGEYGWDLIVVRDSDSEEAVVHNGAIRMFASSSDRRTFAEVMVRKIESLLQGRAESDVSSYTIKSRSISKMGVQELTDWRNYFLDEIGRTGGSADDGTSGPPNNTVRVRFV